MLGCPDPEAASGVRTYSLTDELFQVPSETPIMDGLVPFTVVIRAILFCSGIRGIVLDGSRTPDSGLILDGVEDFVDGELERSELSYQLVGSKQALWEDRECLSLVGRLPSVLILGMVRSFVRRI